MFKYISVRRREELIEQKHNNFLTPTFTPHESYISADLGSAIAIDKDNRLIGLQDPESRCFYFDGANIISSDIIINENTYHKRSFFDMCRRYILGRLIGGKSMGSIASRTSKANIHKTISSIELKIRVNDLNMPIFTIPFLGFSSSQRVQDLAIQDVEYWDSLIKNISNNH